MGEKRSRQPGENGHKFKRSKVNNKHSNKNSKGKSDKDAKLFSSWSRLEGFDDVKAEDIQQFMSAGEEDEIEDYEMKPRSFKADDEADEHFERLPIKSADGKVHRVVTKDPSAVIKQQQKEKESKEQEEESESEVEEEEEEEVKQQVPELTEEQEIRQTQEKIAEVAEIVMEDPEGNVGHLRDLRLILNTTTRFKVKQITILAMVPIFKSIIPGYRIRPLTDSEKSARVSKDVKKIRNFEEGLILNFKEYIETLAVLSKKGKTKPEGSEAYTLACSALRAACELILTVPHFNFRVNLLEIIVDKLSTPKRSVDKAYAQAIKAVQEIFKADDEGHVSFDLMRLLSKMIKARQYKVHEVVVETFLYLRLLTELNVKASMESVEREDNGPKIKKKDRKHMTKRERKIRKENKKIEEEMQKAESAVSAEERERIQSETLKIVFVIYFNILKERSTQLMAVTLEGLAKFAHLINSDFFGDLLEVLRELIVERQTWDVEGEMRFKESTTREALLCIVTAFALLTGQVKAGESMNLDLTFFINHFYSSLYSVGLNPDVEFSRKSLRLADPLQDPLKRVREDAEREYLPKRVDISTEMEMVVSSLDFLFFRNRAANSIRAEAFAKRIATMSLQLPEKSSLAALKALVKMTRRYNILAGLYSTDDRITNGVYKIDVDVPEHSNPEAATIWETVLLEKHYCPKVAKAAALVPKSSIISK